MLAGNANVLSLSERENSNYVSGSSRLEVSDRGNKAVSPPAELAESSRWMRLAVDLQE
jgi:hypothetical protein